MEQEFPEDLTAVDGTAEDEREHEQPNGGVVRVGSRNPVSIVVVSWNAIAASKRLCASLATTRFDDYEIVWVDNASEDGTVDWLRSAPAISPLKLIENEANEGFGAAVNKAIRSIDGRRDVVLINNDIVIEDPEWLTKLQQTAYAKENVGVVGCRLRQDNNLLLHIGTYMPLEGFRGYQLGSNELDVGQGAYEDENVEGIVFACAYIPRRTIERIGLLDEDYFVYYEDTDYCFRAARAGLSVMCCSALTVTHSENTSSREKKVSFASIYEPSRSTFIKKWKCYLTEQRWKSALGWISTLKLPVGYAIASQGLTKALQRADVRLGYKYIYGPGTPQPNAEPSSSGDIVVDDIASRPLMSDAAHVAFGQGDVFHRNTGPFRIGYTMLEVDGLPGTWVDQANDMDEVWVPSQFNAETFRASGVKKPIGVMPLGFDPTYFHPGVTAPARENGDFRFLSVFEWGERKAPEVLLKAFRDEFSKDEEVVLFCHVSNFDASVAIARQINDLRLRRQGGRIVVAVNQRVPFHQMPVLLRSCDCFVLPTRGEGWGLPILEAMACGLPVIATDWSAHRDFFDAKVGYPIEVEGLVNADARCPYYAGLRWAQPSYESLRQQMRRVFLHREQSGNVGAAAAAHVRANFTFDHAAGLIKLRVQELT
jgi:GT2 family glycosyltransferase/glycosyltransferase involved in cell wall biosynthesis